MAWTERQRAMLAEMGIRLWAPVASADEPPEAVPADSNPDARVGANSSAAREALLAEAVRPIAAQNLERSEPVQAARREPPIANASAPGRRLDAVARAPAGAPGPIPDATRAPSGARLDLVRRMGWPALSEAVAECTACKLCKGRTQTVFGVGHPRAHWMVVGEAPGEQEDLAGEPFVGKSGQLLDNMLRAIGLSREGPSAQESTRGDRSPETALSEAGASAGERAMGDPARQVYIANVLKCRPPGNRNPEPEELAQCAPYLVRQIELVQPRIILAMGRFAVQSLLRSSEPIGRLRGRVHHYQGVPLVVTYHPAYLLRNPEDKARAWNDLCLAVETAASVASRSGSAPRADG